MSIRDYKYWNPVLDLRPFRGFAPEVANTIRERVVSFTLTDKRAALDEIRLDLDNYDGKLLDPVYLGLGMTFKVSYGYPGLLATRVMQCRKAQGAVRFGGVGRDTGPRTAAGGVVTLLLKSQIWDMNFQRVLTKAEGSTTIDREGLLIKNATIPQVVARIANSFGYVGPTLYVETLPEEPILEKTSIPARFSVAEWIGDQANRRGWTFAIDESGFHFHSTDYAPATESKEIEDLTWFAGDPDVISWSIKGDLNVPQNVQVKGSENEVAVGYLHGTKHYTNPGVTMFVVDDKKKESLSPNLLLNTSKPSKRRQARTERFFERSMNRWKLTLRLVGNPKISARKKIKLRNFGPLIDGIWTVKECEHSIKADQVYITEITEAVRKPVKFGNIKVAFGALNPTLGNTNVGVAGYVVDSPPLQP